LDAGCQPIGWRLGLKDEEVDDSAAAAAAAAGFVLPVRDAKMNFSKISSKFLQLIK